MIHYVPLEHVESRYTIHLDRDILSYLEGLNLDFNYVMPIDHISPPPKDGMFLNAAFTCGFKAEQNAMIADLFKEDKIQDGDTIFFSDLWHPGVEAIAYMNHFHKKKIKIKGVIHAGSFTDTDFVREFERWAKNFEEMVFDIVDEIFVATEFIKNEICSRRLVNPEKVVVTGLPLDSELFKREKKPKENIVIFNGRNCDEKQPWLFDELKEGFDHRIKFVNTQKENLTRDEYYDLLDRAKCVVSFALQENFGYGIMEAAVLGCVPVVPNRLSYKELYTSPYRYRKIRDCARMVSKAIQSKIDYQYRPLNTNGAIFSRWFE